MMMRKILIFLLCFCTIFLCFVIPSFADEGVTSAAGPSLPEHNPDGSPTDLTGYTVTVPAGWSAFAGYGSFELYGTVENSPFVSFAIGKNPYVGNMANFVGFVTDSGALESYTNGSSFSFTVSSGATTNSSLIQWLVDNDATFSGGSSPEPPEPETSSIAGGIYHFKQFGDLPDIPDAGWSDGEGYMYSYSVAGKMVTTSRNHNFTTLNVSFDEYVSNSYYTVTFSVDTDVGTLNLATYTASYGQVTLVQREGFKYIVFDEALIGTYDDIEFIRDFLVSGLPSGDTSPTDNPWLYILDMIIEALKVDLFGYFSVWDIFTTICGIFIVTWLLKLLAGG